MYYRYIPFMQLFLGSNNTLACWTDYCHLVLKLWEIQTCYLIWLLVEVSRVICKLKEVIVPDTFFMVYPECKRIQNTFWSTVTRFKTVKDDRIAQCQNWSPNETRNKPPPINQERIRIDRQEKTWVRSSKDNATRYREIQVSKRTKI